MKIMPPCKDCSERHAGCHGQCERYADYKYEIDKVRAKRVEEAEKNGMIYDSVMRKRKAKHELIKQK